MKHTSKLTLIALAASLALSACSQNSSNQAASTSANVSNFTSNEQKASYIMGQELGASVHQFKQQGVSVEDEAFLQGVRDSLSGKASPFNEQQTQEIIETFQKEQNAKVEAYQQELAKDNVEKGRAFLEANKAKDGVKTTASGLQYQVLKEGTGKSPSGNDVVTVDYEGSLIDGTVFDSSIKRGEPATFPLGGVIKGWQEGLQLMKEGGEYMLYIPADLAYGDSAQSNIPPNSVLVFKIKLIKVGGSTH